jgi:hypothetical protein
MSHAAAVVDLRVLLLAGAPLAFAVARNRRLCVCLVRRGTTTGEVMALAGTMLRRDEFAALRLGYGWQRPDAPLPEPPDGVRSRLDPVTAELLVRGRINCQMIR